LPSTTHCGTVGSRRRAQGEGHSTNAHVVLAATLILALLAGGEELGLKHRGKVDDEAMYFKATHLSAEECDSINYKVGRETGWSGPRGSSVDTNAEVDTTAAVAEVREGVTGEETPAWIIDIQQKGKDYQAERKRSAKADEDMLSEYTQTEQNIAKNMGLSPRMIDRGQLRKWAQEADSIPLTP
jgi:hypothetical protein